MTTQTATGVLSMQALLYAIGLGAGLWCGVVFSDLILLIVFTGAIPLAATVNWVLKDGLGQLGGVLYGAIYGTHFDDDPKRHRFYAVVALQVDEKKALENSANPSQNTSSAT